MIDEASSGTVTPSSKVEGVCRDPDDDHVLACARAVEADYLVSGDADLLILERFEKTRIVTPRDFEGMMED